MWHMFTGIVEEIGIIKGITPVKNMVQLEILAKNVMTDMSLGDSLATNGVCLTICKIIDTSVFATVMPVTIERTTLSTLKIGSEVNLERAVTPNSRLGGHFMTGHIDGVEEVLSITGNELEKNYKFSLNPEYANMVAKKGSIAVSGVSLTVTDVGDNWFSVSLIPYTIESTILKNLKISDEVNIEVDVIARYLARLLNSDNSPKLTLERMVELGF